MRMLILAAGLAVLAAGSPAWASNGAGRIACENDLRSVVAKIKADPAAAHARVANLDDWLDATMVQCRSSYGLALANIHRLDRALDLPSAQTAWQPDFVEWPNAFD